MQRFVLAVMAALLWLATPAASNAQRVALVLGNGAYQAVPQLSNPGRDADELAQTLRGLGFQIRVVRDATRARFEAALQQSSQDATGAEVAAVLRAMQGARARLLFLDACRDNPFAATLRSVAGTRSVAIGLGRIETADLGTLVAFATAPGTVAADGAGRNSPFAAALTRHLAEPGLDIRQVMTRVRRSVVQQTGGQQVPWDNSSLVTDLVLRAPAAPGPPPEPRRQDTRAPAAAGRFDGVWSARLECPASTDGARNYTVTLPVTVRDNVLRAGVGTQGMPAWLLWEGGIEPNGSAGLRANGLTGNPAITVGRVQPGTPYTYQIVAQFKGPRGTG